MKKIYNTLLVLSLLVTLPVYAAVTTVKIPSIEDIAHKHPYFVRRGFAAAGLSGQYHNGEIINRYWLRNQERIAGANGRTYTPVIADVGQALVFVEEVRDRQSGEVHTVQSKPAIVKSDKLPAQRSAPSTTANSGNTIYSGQTIYARAGGYDNGTVVDRVWYVDNQKVGRGESYTPTVNDIGKTLHYQEFVRNSHGLSASFNSVQVKILAQRTPTPTPPANNDICATILAKNTPLHRTRSVDPMPNIPRPTVHQAIEAPIYNTCLVRVTDSTKQDGAFRRNHYSRRQAFNADSSYMLLAAQSGHWYLYDAKTTRPIKVLKGIEGKDLEGDIEPQWHPTDPNIIYHLSNKGVGMDFYQHDVAKNASTRVADFRARVQARWPSANDVWTKSEGSPSADARYWCFVVQNSAWEQIGVFTWDRQTDKILGMLDLGSKADVNHVSMSPSGRYCVVSGDDARGTRAYDRTFSNHVQLLHKSEHSDIALDQNGNDVYVSLNYQDGNVFMYNIDKKQKTDLFQTYIQGTGTAIHFSGKAYRKPGWILVSTYSEKNDWEGITPLRNHPSRQWFHRKVFAMSLEANPQIRVIAYADADLIPNEGNLLMSYFSEPHATVNQDFTRILFNSSWASTKRLDLAAYMSAINPGALD